MRLFPFWSTRLRQCSFSAWGMWVENSGEIIWMCQKTRFFMEI